MILLPSRRITKPQAGGSVDIQRAYDTGTFYLSFADASFTDRIGGGVVRNPGGLSLGPNGRIATFNGAQQGNSPLWLNGSHVGIIVAARVRATAAQAGTPGAAFGVYDGTLQGGFGVGFDPSGNAGAALLTSGGAYLSSSTPVGLNKWVTVFAQISGVNAGASVSYIDGKPATTGQGASYIGDPRSPNEIAYGAQHRSTGFLRQFKGDIEWAAILRVSPPDGGWRSLTDQLALDLYQSGYPYNLINTTRRIYFDMGAGGGGEPATHDTSGAITSSPAELSGAAERTRQHDTSAELAGAGSVVSATARRNVTLGSSGALSVGLAVVTASASHTAGHAEHSTIGTVAAPGASLSGSASRVPAPVTHDTSGDLGGMGAVIDGQAQGPQTGSMRPGFEMSSRKVYIKRGKRIHIFDSVEDADAWMEAEQQELQAIRRAKPTPRKKAKVFKLLDEAIPHEVVRLDVVRAMVDYLGIPVEMPTLEARQDWAEVARVALMARQMQDEEDIELLLAA